MMKLLLSDAVVICCRFLNVSRYSGRLVICLFSFLSLLSSCSSKRNPT